MGQGAYSITKAPLSHYSGTMAAKHDQARRWTFTLNNPEDHLEDDPNKLPYAYLVWQKEVGKEGTPHLQGFVCLKRQARLAALKKLMPAAHWEVMGGSVEHNEGYCTKCCEDWEDPGHSCKKQRLDGPWVRGEKPKPGTRTDWEVFKSDCKSQISYIDLADKHFSIFMRYPRSFDRSFWLFKPKARALPTIIIFWGSSGTNKSWFVEQWFPESYRKNKSAYWDMYHGEDCVVFEEFYSWLTLDDMLKIVDWPPLMIDVKHSSAYLTATTFVFTSNEDPRTWYPNMKDKPTYLALWRRISEYGLVYRIDPGGVFVKDDVKAFYQKEVEYSSFVQRR